MDEAQAKGGAEQDADILNDEALADGKRTITLEVRESNADAQRFYRQFLFRTIGVRKRYYSDNREDALLMVLDLAAYAGRKGGDEGTPQTG